MNKPTFSIALAGLVTIVSAAGCREALEFRTSSNAQRFPVMGTVTGIDRAHARLTIAHEPVAGYMDAMTMPFRVRERDAVEAAEVGAGVRAILVVDGQRSWIEAVSLTNRPTDAASLRRSFTLGATPGQTIPDFHLTNQDGRPISLSQFRGKAVALTFIYARCPLPDFCPFVSRNFAAAERELERRPRLRQATQLLSVTIDPEHDTPDILRDYRSAFLSYPDRTDHWQLATGSPKEVRAIAQFFGLQYWAEEGQLVHSLRTVVIDPDGRITHVDAGNAWKPSGLVAELERAVQRRREAGRR